MFNKTTLKVALIVVVVLLLIGLGVRQGFIPKPF